MIDELCNCGDCQLADQPCHLDCNIDSECIGCLEARLTREDITHDIVYGV